MTETKDQDLRLVLARVLDRLDTLEEAVQRIEALEAQVQSLLPAKHLPFYERLPDKERITKLHADLFHNPTAKQGEPKRVLKVFVTLDDDTNKNGSIAPLHFWMYDPRYLDLSGQPDSLLTRLWSAVNDRPDALLGCIHHKGRRKASGTSKVVDCVAYIGADHILMIGKDDGGRSDIAVNPNPVKATKASGEAKSAKAPAMSWTWYRPRD